LASYFNDKVAEEAGGDVGGGIAPIRSLLQNDQIIEPFKHLMSVAGQLQQALDT